MDSVSAVQGSLGQEDLFNILLAQLKYQDPLKPMDNQQFITQLAQFVSLEQTRQMNDKVDDLLRIQSATQSIGLIGRTVQARGTDGATVSGKVGTITFQEGVPNLTIVDTGGLTVAEVSLSQIYLVR
jgi:flagellar basal-body rod modification protein FlgD